jgi:FkbM family methyltransferase
MKLRRAIKQILPPPVVRSLTAWRQRRRQKQYFSQPFVTVKCGSYDLTVPKSHILVTLGKVQPYRDMCIAIGAQEISRKYPSGTFVDIGANVGDTAAIMATYANNPLILVEASDYFFDLLVKNVRQIPSVRQVKKAFVANGESIAGDLEHWGGTACFRVTESGNIRAVTTKLSEVCDDQTCFIKLDTDGYDFPILLDSITFLATQRPAILFENWIRNSEDLAAANDVVEALCKVGYSGFLVWDDPGFHLVSTTEVQVVKDLNRYLFKTSNNPGHKAICNYDVLCVHDRDMDLFANISHWWRNY